MRQDQAEKRADAVIAAMQGGPICDVSPERSRALIAEALMKAAEDERAACEQLVEDEGSDAPHPDAGKPHEHTSNTCSTCAITHPIMSRDEATAWAARCSLRREKASAIRARGQRS